MEESMNKLKEKIRQETIAEITGKVNQKLDERFIEFANVSEEKKPYSYLLALGYVAAYQDIDLLTEKDAHSFLDCMKALIKNGGIKE